MTTRHTPPVGGRNEAINHNAMILGAGASRGVSYAHEVDLPSPLDYDFFDLLQRLIPSESDREACDYVLRAVGTLPHEYRRSMEKSFYTLQLRAYLSEILARQPKADVDVIRHFARAIQAVLRQAHGRKKCKHHQNFLSRLHHADTVVSFNYDLVPERAMIKTAAARNVEFGDWIYGFEPHPPDKDLPLILKLHGSSNWRVEGDNEFKGSNTENWQAFDTAPRYRGYKGDGTVFPIFLPFWDKRIEQGMWRDLWQNAYNRLHETKSLIVWGYSLPMTDVKAQQLFTLALVNLRYLCVIDVARATRERWRELLPFPRYWEYDTADDFFKHPPSWWKSANPGKGLA